MDGAIPVQTFLQENRGPYLFHCSHFRQPSQTIQRKGKNKKIGKNQMKIVATAKLNVAVLDKIKQMTETVFAPKSVR